MGNELKRDKDGRLICPKCSKPIDCITQAHYEHLEWDENLKKYCKIEWPGDYQNPICGECNEYLDTKYTQIEITTNEEVRSGLTKKKKKELEKVILYDLEALKDTSIIENKKDFAYHFELLKGNLKDYFKGNKEGNKLNKLKGVISKAVDTIESYNRKDNVQVAAVWDILREAEREWRE